MEKYLVLATFVGSIIALLFALITGKRVLGYEEGTPLMSKISRSIREGANAYLRRQYTVVGIFFACMVQAADLVRTLCIPDRRLFLRSLRLCGHAHCHKGQLPHRQCLPRRAE